MAETDFQNQNEMQIENIPSKFRTLRTSPWFHIFKMNANIYFKVGMVTSIEVFDT